MFLEILHRDVRVSDFGVTYLLCEEVLSRYMQVIIRSEDYKLKSVVRTSVYFWKYVMCNAVKNLKKNCTIALCTNRTISLCTNTLVEQYFKYCMYM